MVLCPLKSVSIQGPNENLHFLLMTSLDLYYLALPEDRVSSKVLVYGVYILETAQTIFLSDISIYVYTHSPDVFTSPAQFRSSTTILYLSLGLSPLLGGLSMVSQMDFQFRDLLLCKVVFTVQSFHVYRLGIFTCSWVIKILIILVRKNLFSNSSAAIFDKSLQCNQLALFQLI
jgi:hypothetical protein